MKRTISRMLRTRGTAQALIIALVLLTFLSAMIAVVIRGNVIRRQRLRQRQDAITALHLAESGASEALNALAKGDKEIAITKSAGEGQFQVTCAPASPETPGAYLIRSVGISHPDDPIAPKRSVVVSVQRAESGLRILSWQSEPFGRAAAPQRD